jgi:hypothetical protein
VRGSHGGENTLLAIAPVGPEAPLADDPTADDVKKPSFAHLAQLEAYPQSGLDDRECVSRRGEKEVGRRLADPNRSRDSASEI